MGTNSGGIMRPLPVTEARPSLRDVPPLNATTLQERLSHHNGATGSQSQIKPTLAVRTDDTKKEIDDYLTKIGEDPATFRRENASLFEGGCSLATIKDLTSENL